MKEHKPPGFLVWAMSAFFWATASFALAFWILSLVWPNGPGGLLVSLGAATAAVFGTAHIPAAISGVLLWHWRRRVMAPRKRALLETATVYFGSVVGLAMAGNFAAMMVLDGMY